MSERRPQRVSRDLKAARERVKWPKKENIVRKVGVEVEIGDKLVYSTQKSDYRTVGALDRSRIVKLYFWGTDGKGMGIGKVGKHPEINRSPSTVRDHLSVMMRRSSAPGSVPYAEGPGGSSSRRRSTRRPPVGREDSNGAIYYPLVLPLFALKTLIY